MHESSTNSNQMQQKFARYGALLAAISGVNQADGAVIYTDENPDFAGGIGSQYYLDLNNDGTDDFRIYTTGYSSYVNLYIQPLAAGNEVLGTGGATFAYPFAMSSGSNIGGSAGTWFNNGFAGGYQSMNYGMCSFGSNWCSVTNKYLGLRFQVGANTYYGWARLDVNGNGSTWTLKDYAYDDSPNTPIIAGDVGGTPSDPATAVMGADVDEFANGLDLQVNFSAASNESTLSEYRIMVVKASNAGSFTDFLANSITAGNYESVTPNGSSNYTQVLTATSNDVDGDLITTGQPYVIFILSIADGINATINTLSVGSSPVTLVTHLQPALNIVGTDIANNSNGLDIQVDFDAANNENGLDQYRIMVVKTANAGTFDFAQASTVSFGRFTPQVPNGSPSYTVILNDIVRDVDGDELTIGIPYTIFILSRGALGSGSVDSLSSGSASFTLNTPADVALNVAGYDVSNFANGQDVKVLFDAALDENKLDEYRIMIVKDANASSFNVAVAQAVPSTSYTVVLPDNDPSYSKKLAPTAKDVDGDLIVENVMYQAFVMSTMNNVTSNQDAISAGSAAFQLTQAVGIAENEYADIQVYNNGSGIYINVPSEITARLNVTLHTIDGKLIESRTVSNGVILLNTNGLAKGTYLVNFTDEQNNLLHVRKISF